MYQKIRKEKEGEEMMMRGPNSTFSFHRKRVTDENSKYTTQKQKIKLNKTVNFCPWY